MLLYWSILINSHLRHPVITYYYPYNIKIFKLDILLKYAWPWMAELMYIAHNA